jgi:hypothetical protein
VPFFCRDFEFEFEGSPTVHPKTVTKSVEVQLLYLTYFGKTLRAVTLKYFVQPKAATNQNVFYY